MFGTHSVGDGLVQPTIYFSANGGPLSFGPPGAFYAQSANLSYTFEYSFDLNSEAWLTPNPVYCTCSFYGPASAVLMQGQNVVATATSSAESGFQPLVFPAMYLAANTQYKLSISQFGPLDTFTGNGLFSQIALDISPVPEPGPALMFVAGLAALGLRHVSRISLEPRKVVRQIDA